MKIGSTHIENTFAEAFRMRYVRVIVTAHDDEWVAAATREFAGYGSSIISCDAEAGVERRLDPLETPDGRPGASVLLFGFSEDGLAKAVPNRTGQCLMTCATSAVFDGLKEAENRISLGKHLRYFGDGFQKSKVVSGRRYWRIPVMDGEFLVEDTLGVEKGIAGGNIILQAENLAAATNSARRVVETLKDVPGVITPFPGGVVRSGSKVGSRYKSLRASTNHSFCPTLRGQVDTQLHPGADFAYEIVMNGVDEEVIRGAMAISLRAAAGPGIVAVGAGNYGGHLGKFHFHLREVLTAAGEKAD